MTTCFNTKQYDLININKFKKADSQYIVDDAIILLIKSISEKVGAPSYIKTPTFHNKKREEKKKKQRKNMDISDDDWKAIKDFQITEKKDKEGIDKLLDMIRCELNKISDKNYEKQKDRILEMMTELMTNDSFNDVDKSNVVKLIFDIASNNKFYSFVYAQLYKELICVYSCMNNILTEHINNYKDMYKNIEYCDPDKDYDKFCRNNKLNESRRSLTSFIVNLNKLDVISTTVIFDMIDYLKNITKEMSTDSKNVNILSEITENIYILIAESKNKLKLHDEEDYEKIYNYVIHMKSLKAKNEPGLSSKIIFKYMDLFDKLNKS
tara:strand:+ start:1885 stop:2853 length:969 start_codon:yes stop_codon:yes gene_type:complete